MIVSMLGNETLFELRCSVQLAEMERRGGQARHVSPFAKVRKYNACKCTIIQHQDIGALMNRAGFAMITLDADELVVHYPHIFALMHDLQVWGGVCVYEMRTPRAGYGGAIMCVCTRAHNRPEHTSRRRRYLSRMCFVIICPSHVLDMSCRFHSMSRSLSLYSPKLHAQNLGFYVFV
jgi:hypothetical protein